MKYFTEKKTKGSEWKVLVKPWQIMLFFTFYIFLSGNNRKSEKLTFVSTWWSFWASSKEYSGGEQHSNRARITQHLCQSNGVFSSVGWSSCGLEIGDCSGAAGCRRLCFPRRSPTGICLLIWKESTFQPSFSLLSPVTRIMTSSRAHVCGRWRGKAPTPPTASWLPRPGMCWRNTTNPWRRPKVEAWGGGCSTMGGGQLKQQKPCLVFESGECGDH